MTMTYDDDQPVWGSDAYVSPSEAAKSIGLGTHWSAYFGNLEVIELGCCAQSVAIPLQPPSSLFDFSRLLCLKWALKAPGREKREGIQYSAEALELDSSFPAPSFGGSPSQDSAAASARPPAPPSWEMAFRSVGNPGMEYGRIYDWTWQDANRYNYVMCYYISHMTHVYNIHSFLIYTLLMNIGVWNRTLSQTYCVNFRNQRSTPHPLEIFRVLKTVLQFFVIVRLRPGLGLGGLRSQFWIVLCPSPWCSFCVLRYEISWDSRWTNPCNVSHI